MTRLEEALAKLQARRTEGVGSERLSQVAAPAAAREPLPATITHSYGGMPLHVNLDELRRVGLTAADPNDRRLAEQYRMVKRPLLKNAAPGHVPQMLRANLLLVTSALPGEGKTFTCLNLCLSMAREQDWSVVLVDGDSNKPNLSRLFGVGNEPGLMDLLRDSTTEFDSMVMPTDIPNLSFLPAGTRHTDSVELLASSAMRTLCDRTSSSDPQRMIVFDSPPLLLTSEGPALAAQLSQIVVVVKANKTPQRAVVAALGRLDPTKAISLVLNQATKTTNDGEYGGDYYGYGD
jgi:protein-tyrosine kinase